MKVENLKIPLKLSAIWGPWKTLEYLCGHSALEFENCVMRYPFNNEIKYPQTGSKVVQVITRR